MTPRFMNLASTAFTIAAISLGTPMLAQETSAQNPKQQDQGKKQSQQQGEQKQSVEERLSRLEQENEAMREALSQELESIRLGDLVPEVTESKHGMGPAASKIYQKDEGLSIGGYGEFLFQQNSGSTDRADALRAITYFGYKFNDKFLFNSEIEYEHGSTSKSGSASLEFGYLDYMHSEAFNLRAGLVLVPMGLVNENHEPTTFFTANRSETERRIIPSTWREMGLGAYGEAGGFSYRSYLLNGLNGENYTSSGVRGARQKGSKAAADDWAGVLRVDYIDIPGLLLGGSIFYGKSGQDNIDGSSNFIPSMNTTIVEAHADYKINAWSFRALYAHNFIDDAAEFNTNTGNNIADESQGYYGEVAFDVLSAINPDGEQSLSPYFRAEHIDTQYKMPTGFTSAAGKEDDIYTIGINYKPIDQITVKVDFEYFDRGSDRFNLLFGYIF